MADKTAPLKYVANEPGRPSYPVYAVGPYLVSVYDASHVTYQLQESSYNGVRAAIVELFEEGLKKLGADALARALPPPASPDLFADVGAFHAKFALGRYPLEPLNILSGSTLEFRIKFMQEELNEFSEACADADICSAADALADLVYVALGTAHLMGIPFNEVWAEVQRANMKKERASGADDSRSKRAHALDVVKPEGWQPPDHRKALGIK